MYHNSCQAFHNNNKKLGHKIYLYTHINPVISEKQIILVLETLVLVEDLFLHY